MPNRSGTTIIDADIAAIAKHGMCGYKDTANPAFQQKLAWLKKRFPEGLKVKLLLDENGKTAGSIEFIPGEYSWRAMEAPDYMVIHCLFILKKALKGKGYGSSLIAACEDDALEAGTAGVATVTSKSTWMAKKAIFIRNGYERVEEAPPHFELLVKRFQKDAPLPSFTEEALENRTSHDQGLVIYHSHQCPYVNKTMAELPEVAQEEFGIKPRLVKLSNNKSARKSPNPYGVFGITWNGKLVADHPISATRFKNILKKIDRD